MIAEVVENNGDIISYKIERTEKNIRKRPNEVQRFQGSEEVSHRAD